MSRPRRRGRATHGARANDARGEREEPRARARWAAMLGGAIASAALFAIYARVEAPWHALGFVVLAPWIVSLTFARSGAEAALAGAVMSGAFVGAVFPWLPGAAAGYAHASSPWGAWIAALALAPIFEPQLVVFAWARHAARRSAGRAAAGAIGAAAYVATELLFPKLFFDTLGQGLYPAVDLRQAADVAGVHGLTLLVVLVNEGVAGALDRWRRRGSGRAGPSDARPPRWTLGGRVPVDLAASLAAVAIATAYGAVRRRQIDGRAEERAVTIGAVQANVTNYDKLRAEEGAYGAVRAVLDAHYALSDDLRARAPVDLLVWPETVYPTTFGAPKSDAGAELDAEIRAFVAARATPLVFGAYDLEGDREYNAAFFVAPPGDVRPSSPSYRKRMLFPLTEWVPDAIDSSALRSALPWTGRWRRGPGAAAVDVPLARGGAIAVAPLICYDVLFTDYVAEAAGKGADVLLTISNDSWFPDERAPRLHLISAAFRSIETRLPQLRATNSGISAVITPTGEMTATTPWERRDTLLARIPISARARPPLLIAGRPLAVLLALGAIAIAWASRRRRAPASRRSADDG